MVQAVTHYGGQIGTDPSLLQYEMKAAGEKQKTLYRDCRKKQ